MWLVGGLEFLLDKSVRDDKPAFFIVWGLGALVWPLLYVIVIVIVTREMLEDAKDRRRSNEH